jgi:hypothetical protein
MSGQETELLRRVYYCRIHGLAAEISQVRSFLFNRVQNGVLKESRCILISLYPISLYGDNFQSKILVFTGHASHPFLSPSLISIKASSPAQGYKS